MSSFFGGGNGAAAQPQQPPRSKEEFMRSLQNEIAKKKLTDLINSMQTQCFKRCVMRPADTLSSSEQGCVSGCVDKYWETFDIVAREWNKNINAMSKNQAGGGFFGR